VAFERRALASVPEANIEKFAATPLDRARLSLPCSAEGYLSTANGWWPSPLRGAAFVSYEYRLFMVQEAKEWTFMHLASEPLAVRTGGVAGL